MKKYIVILLSLIFNTVLIVPQQTTLDHTITVFIHETFPMRKLLHRLPGKSLTYTEQGLSLAKNLPKNYHFYKIAKGCIELNNHDYSWDRFYIFGWKSEKISDQVRKNAAQDLTKDLIKIAHDYFKQHNIRPSIRLIGYSHGGNVILHAADYLPLIVDNKKIDIEAWIFGTPIQQFNKDGVNQNKFTKFYSFYSTNDWIQRIDPQGLYNKQLRKKHFWSDRMFSEDSNCIQINFTVHNKSISHIYYRSLFKYFPLIQQATEAKVKSTNLKSGMITINFEKPKK